MLHFGAVRLLWWHDKSATRILENPAPGLMTYENGRLQTI